MEKDSLEGFNSLLEGEFLHFTSTNRKNTFPTCSRSCRHWIRGGGLSSRLSAWLRDGLSDGVEEQVVGQQELLQRSASPAVLVELAELRAELERAELVEVLQAGRGMFDHTGCIETVGQSRKVAVDRTAVGFVDRTAVRTAVRIAVRIAHIAFHTVVHIVAVQMVVVVRKVVVRKGVGHKVVVHWVAIVVGGMVACEEGQQLVSFPLYLLRLPFPLFPLLFLQLALLVEETAWEAVGGAVVSVGQRMAGVAVDRVEDMAEAEVDKMERKD